MGGLRREAATRRRRPRPRIDDCGASVRPATPVRRPGTTRRSRTTATRERRASMSRSTRTCPRARRSRHELERPASWNNLGPCDPHPADRFSPNRQRTTSRSGVRERDQRSLMARSASTLPERGLCAAWSSCPHSPARGSSPSAIPEQEILQAQIRYYQYCDPSNPVFLDKATLRQVGTPSTRTAGRHDALGADHRRRPTERNADGLRINMPADDGLRRRCRTVHPHRRRGAARRRRLECRSTSTRRRASSSWPRGSPTAGGGSPTFGCSRTTRRPSPGSRKPTIGGGTCCARRLLRPHRSRRRPARFSGSVVIDFNNIGGIAAGEPRRRQHRRPAGDLERRRGIHVPRRALDDERHGEQQRLGPLERERELVRAPGDRQLQDERPTRIPHGSNDRPRHYRNNEIAPLLTMVHTSAAGPGGERAPGRVDGLVPGATSATSKTIFPTVGLESSIRVGQRRILRLDRVGSHPVARLRAGHRRPGPRVGHVHDRLRPVVHGQQVPGPAVVVPGQPARPPATAPTSTASASSPTARRTPGSASPRPRTRSARSVIGDGISGAIGNCRVPSNNGCQHDTCTNPNYYDPANPDQWALDGGERARASSSSSSSRTAHTSTPGRRTVSP